MARTKRAISYGEFQPAVGAWLYWSAGILSYEAQDTYFQTKLKVIRPLIPSIEPIQSIGSDLLRGLSEGSRSARLPKTINPSKALITSCQLHPAFPMGPRIHKDKQPLPRRKLSQKTSKQSPQPSTHRGPSAKKAQTQIPHLPRR